MMEFANAVVDRVESIFDGFGLMVGPYAPLKRSLIGVLLVGVFLSWLKPTMFFTNGRPKKFGGGDGETYFTWWVAAIIFGSTFGLFI